MLPYPSILRASYGDVLIALSQCLSKLRPTEDLLLEYIFVLSPPDYLQLVFFYPVPRLVLRFELIFHFLSASLCLDRGDGISLNWRIFLFFENVVPAFAPTPSRYIDYRFAEVELDDVPLPVFSLRIALETSLSFFAAGGYLISGPRLDNPLRVDLPFLCLSHLFFAFFL